MTKIVFFPQRFTLTHRSPPLPLLPSLTVFGAVCTFLPSRSSEWRIQGDCVAHIFAVNRVTAAGPDCTAALLCSALLCFALVCLRALAWPSVRACVLSCVLMCSQQDEKEASRSSFTGRDPWSSGPLLLYQTTLFELSSVNLHSGPYL